MDKKKVEAQFTISDIVPIVGTLAVAGIFAGYSLKIMGDTKNTLTANSVEANATGDAITGVSKITGQMPTIGLIAGAVIIIGMLGYLIMKR